MKRAVDDDMRKIVETDLDYIDSLDTIIKDLENQAIKQARYHNRKYFDLLQTIIGCGPVTALDHSLRNSYHYTFQHATALQ